MPTAPEAPKQTRALKTRSKLINALERLLRDDEFENISVQDIAREAGVAVGSVYSHFKDKEAFLEAMLIYWQERVETQLRLAESQDTEAAFIAFGSLSKALREVVRAVLLQTKESAHILRAVQTYSRLNPDAGDAEWQSLVIRSFQPFNALFTAFDGEITVPDQDRALRMLGIFLNTIFIRTALMPNDTLIEAAGLDEESMVEEATAMALRYLTG